MTRVFIYFNYHSNKPINAKMINNRVEILLLITLDLIVTCNNHLIDVVVNIYHSIAKLVLILFCSCCFYRHVCYVNELIDC